MNRLLIILTLILHISACESVTRYEPFVKIEPSSFSSEGYKCRFVNDLDHYCRIYFTSGAYTTFVIVDKDFKKDEYGIFMTGNKFEYYYEGMKPSEYKLIDNYKVKTLESGELKISENIILYEKTKKDINKDFEGIFTFNDKTYEIVLDKNDDIEYGIAFTSGYKDLANQYGVSIVQVDENTVVFSSSIVSEYPVYNFKFDDNGDLLLYPIIGDYDVVNPICYKLKRGCNE